MSHSSAPAACRSPATAAPGPWRPASPAAQYSPKQCEKDNLFLSRIRNAGTIHDEDIAAAGWSEQFLPADPAEEATTMARQRQETSGWPTILWIAWQEGETERLE